MNNFDLKEHLELQRRHALLNEKLRVAIEALESIISEYAEDIYDIDYNPHQNPAFRIANEAVTKIKERL